MARISACKSFGVLSWEATGSGVRGLPPDHRLRLSRLTFFSLWGIFSGFPFWSATSRKGVV